MQLTRTPPHMASLTGIRHVRIILRSSMPTWDVTQRQEIIYGKANMMQDVLASCVDICG